MSFVKKKSQVAELNWDIRLCVWKHYQNYLIKNTKIFVELLGVGCQNLFNICQQLLKIIQYKSIVL